MKPSTLIKPQSMNILIAGDFFISDNYQGQNLIDKSVLNLFEKADYRIVNLETPITANEPENRILKTGPHLRSLPDTLLPFLKQLKVDMVSLANNHILDYGPKGLSDTFKSLQENKIRYVGAGKNLEAAAKPFTLEKDGIKIAILNFAENEWSIAEEDKHGANPLDIIDNVNQIKTAKATHDKVICIIHGGHEYYYLPSPRMAKQYRFYAENGADAIVGHHTHCIGGYEVYKDVPIIYSLGNFLFTMQSIYKDWYIGLILEVEIRNGELFTHLHPIKQQEKTFALSLLKNEEKQDVLNRVSACNAIISDELKLKHEWNTFVESKYDTSLNYWSPFSFVSNRYLRALLNKMGIKGINKKRMALTLNLMRCEAHADVTKKSISLFLYGKNLK
jgi:hypothetical protein